MATSLSRAAMRTGKGSAVEVVRSMISRTNSAVFLMPPQVPFMCTRTEIQGLAGRKNS